MATAFPRTLGGAQPPQQDPYQMLLAEYAKLGEQQPQPMFTPEQQADRIRQNNQLMNLGLLGQLSQDEASQNVGGQVFKRALAERGERQTEQGTFDPLTGTTAENPEYRRQQTEQRRGRVLEKALAYQGQRESAQERANLARERDQERRDLRIMLAGMSGNKSSLPKPPQGYRYSADGQSLEAIPGGPAAAKVAATDEKKANLIKNSMSKANLIIGEIDRAESQVNKGTTGIVGKNVAKIAGTPAYNLRATINTIKANIGFEELQAMRQASPTGGALGQVAIRELDMLQAVLGNLDADQGEEQLRRNLKQVKSHFQNWYDVVSSQEVSPGGAASGSGAPAPARPVSGPASPSGIPGGGLTPEEQAELDTLRKRFNK